MKAIFNRHLSDFNADFTIEFNVKNPTLPNISEESMQYEYETGEIVNLLGNELVSELNYNWLKDWSFAGRSNGWFVLICEGDINKVQARTITKLENLVEKYFKEYKIRLEENYSCITLDS